MDTTRPKCKKTAALDKISTCNCKNKKECPMPEKYMAKSIVYQATVSTNDNNHYRRILVALKKCSKPGIKKHENSFKSHEKIT